MLPTKIKKKIRKIFTRSLIKSYPFVFDFDLTDFLEAEFEFIDDDFVRVEDLNIYLFVCLYFLINNMQ